MARKSEFYKGKRKRRNYALIPFAILLSILALVVTTFYGMQKYAVITKDGVNVELPIFDDEKTYVDSQGHTVKEFPQVETSLVFDEPDYSRVKATAGKHVQPLRAIYVSAENINDEKITEFAARLNMGNALVLEMKPRTGQLMWNSQSAAARNFGLSASPELSGQVMNCIDKLKGRNNGEQAPAEGQVTKDVYLVAQISCCLDNLFASRSTSVALRTSYGANFIDKDGTWLDPYSIDVRSYVVELVRELYDMGFDEVVLADVRHPVMELPEGADPENQVGFTYSREMSTQPGPVNAVCGFALSVAEELRDRDGLLSIYCSSPVSLVKADPKTGQDASLFMKVFDRVYYPTDKGSYSFNVSDIESSVTVGKVEDRFVPVVINYLPPSPDTVSWVLIDVEEKEED